MFFKLSFSQVNSGKVIYIASLDKSKFLKKKTSNRLLGNFLKKLKKESNIFYVLTFNNKKALFKKDDVLEKENSGNPLTAIFTGSGIYYYDIHLNESLIQKESLGENFIIDNDVKYEWKYTQETKKIGDYLCYKAKTIKRTIGRKGNLVEKDIVAWYTLDIPIKFGIKDYQGLPGATILLEDGKITYSASKIILNKTYKITKPNKGKKITQKQFDEYLQKNFKNF